MNLKPLALLSALLLASAANAQITIVESNNLPQGQPVPTSGDPKKLICEGDVELGTRIPNKKVCMTSEQWAERARHDREWLEKRQMEICARSFEGGCGVSLPGVSKGPF